MKIFTSCFHFNENSVSQSIYSKTRLEDHPIIKLALYLHTGIERNYIVMG